MSTHHPSLPPDCPPSGIDSLRLLLSTRRQPSGSSTRCCTMLSPRLQPTIELWFLHTLPAPTRQFCRSLLSTRRQPSGTSTRCRLLLSSRCLAAIRRTVSPPPYAASSHTAVHAVSNAHHVQFRVSDCWFAQGRFNNASQTDISQPIFSHKPFPPRSNPVSSVRSLESIVTSAKLKYCILFPASRFALRSNVLEWVHCVLVVTAQSPCAGAHSPMNVFLAGRYCALVVY
eukprot:gene33028-40760_t